MRFSATTKQVLHQIHLWIGIILCVPLVLIGVTGSVLVFEHELEHLLTPQPLLSLTQGEQRSAADIAAAALRHAPENYQLSQISLPAEENAPATARYAKKPDPHAEPGPATGSPAAPRSGGPEESVELRLDPVSLSNLGRIEKHEDGLLRQIFLLHANALMDRETGRPVIGYFGIVMLFLGVSGIVMWWPRPGQWRGAFTVSSQAKGVKLHRDLHGAVGIWGLLVFVVVSFSGVYLAFPQSVGAGIKSALPARELRLFNMKIEPQAEAANITPDDIVSLAQAQIPDGMIRSISFPTKPDQPARVTMVYDGHEDGAPSITVIINPYTKEVVEYRDPRSYSAGETIMAWQHALHAGHGLGALWKVLVFVIGFAPLLFSITGISMWVMKRRARKRMHLQGAAYKTASAGERA